MKKLYSLCAIMAFSAASFAQAQLPFTFNGGSGVITSTTGLSQSGLGSDYTSANVTSNLKFDSTGDYIILNYTGTAVQLLFDIKHNKSNTNVWSSTQNVFKVYSSTDGSTYSNVVFDSANYNSVLDSGETRTIEILNQIPQSTTHLKFIYENKTASIGGNVGFGNLRLNDAANVLSVKQDNIAGLSIYPNPANTVVNISSDLNGIKNVEIYDVLGKQVIKTSTEMAVNVSALNAGVYMVKITQDGKSATRKLVIK